MDLVIPLIEHTGNDYAELRFSLRSYEKYMPHERVVIIGGRLPHWLGDAAKRGDILYMCFIDSPDPKFREANIFLKVREYIEKENSDDDFIFANDDYFLLKPWDPLPPYPHKGSLSTSLKIRSTIDPYRKTIKNTVNILGLEANNLDVHAPMVMNPKIFKKVFGERKKDENGRIINQDEYNQRHINWRTPYGFLFKTLYGQHFDTYPSPDIKFNLMKDVHNGVMNGVLTDVSFFTTDNPACGEELESLLTMLYPEPSRYEQ